MVLLKICTGVARGLDYLHHGTSSEDKIVHRDVKPSNILLDSKLVAKLSDFRLCKKGFADQQQSEPIKTKVRGTIGYFAPEYVYNDDVTRKTDVYAFCVVLLEVLCRKQRGWPLHDDSNDSNEDEEDIGDWARRNIVLDLKDQISQACLDDFIDIARSSLLTIPQDRPSMTNVVSKLQKALKLQNNCETAKSKNSFPEAARKHLQARPWDDYIVITHNRVIVPLTSPVCSSTSSQDTSSGSTSNQAMVPHLNMLRRVPKILIVRAILKELFRINVDERDVSKYEGYRLELRQLDCNDHCLPHLFVRAEYVGRVEVFIQLYERRKLASLLGGSPLTLLCDHCGDAMTCHVCVWSRKFLVCKVCNSLTMVSRKEEVKLRCCSECQTDHLFLRTLILRTEGDVSLEGTSLFCAQNSDEGFGAWWEYVTFVFEGVSAPSRDQHSKLAYALIILIFTVLFFILFTLSSAKEKDQSLIFIRSLLEPFIDWFCRVFVAYANLALLILSWHCSGLAFGDSGRRHSGLEVFVRWVKLQTPCI